MSLMMQRTTRRIPLGNLGTEDDGMSGYDAPIVDSGGTPATASQITYQGEGTAVTSNVTYPTSNGNSNTSSWSTGIANAFASVARSLSPILASNNLKAGQSMAFNPATGQYVITTGSNLSSSLTSMFGSTGLSSSTLILLAVGVGAILILKNK